MGDASSPAPGSSTNSAHTDHQQVDGYSTTNASGELISDPQAGFPPQGTQMYGTSPHAFVGQLDMAPSPNSRQGSFNMDNMAAALPQNAYRSGQYPSGAQQQRYPPAPYSPSAMLQMPQMPQLQQFQGQAGMPLNPQYYIPQQNQMPQYYGGQPPSQMPANMTQRQAVGYYPTPMMINQQPNHGGTQYYYAQTNQYAPQSPVVSGNMMPSQYMSGNPVTGDPRALSQSPSMDQGFVAMYSNSPQGPNDAGDGRSSVVRGPPRKPRQSGHAIWIGNLPPQTDLMHLVHHVCKEAKGLESLFLISKSNCAFANFKDEQTCAEAQQKLHDSKFQSVRLVSRLRKSTVEGATGVTAPTGPSASATSQPSQDGSPIVVTSHSGKASPATSQSVEGKGDSSGDGTPQKDKYFILKSLTVEDLELSVRTGIWATQSHNEEGLNGAFKTADNVYLVFSANKSGEYFGYARMTSQINEDPAAAIEFAPKAQSANDTDLPKAIPTEATEFAPRGRIIDDSARGTIFWEAEREDGESGDEDESETSSREEAEEEPKAWGKPFKLEWLSTAKLPFYRTRGLRNPWNSNREVKIARDGTEIEPSVGRRLIGLFNRVQSPVPARQGMAIGYPHMRPPYQ